MPEEVHLDLQPIPVFSSKDYEFWSIKMKTLISATGFFNLVENEYNEPYDEASDASSLYLIREAMEDNVFHVVVLATSAKEALECLRREFGVGGQQQCVTRC